MASIVTNVLRNIVRSPVSRSIGSQSCSTQKRVVAPVRVWPCREKNLPGGLHSDNLPQPGKRHAPLLIGASAGISVSHPQRPPCHINVPALFASVFPEPRSFVFTSLAHTNEWQSWVELSSLRPDNPTCPHANVNANYHHHASSLLIARQLPNCRDEEHA